MTITKLVRAFVHRRRAGRTGRRRRALERAARERELRGGEDGSIWRTGKGGGHHDR